MYDRLTQRRLYCLAEGTTLSRKMGVTSSLLDGFGERPLLLYRRNSDAIFHRPAFNSINFITGNILEVGDLLQRFKSHDFDFALGADKLKVPVSHMP